MLAVMDRPQLRQVPARPPGPVDPAEALDHVAAELPELSPEAAVALALVDVAGRTRTEVAAAQDLSTGELGEHLAVARTALRRALHPLPGSGWCGRAERLLSDRLDGELDERGGRILDVHLDNCPRCVEHDRRLAQAQVALLGRFVDAHPAVALALESDDEAGLAPVPPALRVVPEQAPEATPEPGATSSPAAKPAPLPARTTARVPAVTAHGNLAWTGLAAVAVLLTVLSVALAIAGALGASL
jgi:putative zinc finger protein